MYYNLFNVAKIKRNIRLSNESNKAFDRDVNSFLCNFMPVNVILCLRNIKKLQIYLLYFCTILH